MSDKAVVYNKGIGLAGWMGLLFITLKLCGIIAWPWIWVLAPFWIGIAILIAICILIPLVVLAVAGVAWLIAGTIAWICTRR